MQSIGNVIHCVSPAVYLCLVYGYARAAAKRNRGKCLYDDTLYQRVLRIYNVFLACLSAVLCVYAIYYAYTSSHTTHGLVCMSTDERALIIGRIFYTLKWIEWLDTLALLNKHNGQWNRLSRLHCIHHAIVPAMTYFGLGQPGDLYVIASNSLAHWLMYAYYAYPKLLHSFKGSITLYQYIQHLGALCMIGYQLYGRCNVHYPWFNILGYVYFFGEYAWLVGATRRRSSTPIPSQYSLSRWTSYLFITNAMHVLWRGQFCYAIASVLLTYTSVQLRRCFPRRTLDLKLDYLAVALFIAYGAKHWHRTSVVTDAGLGYHLIVGSTVGICALLRQYRCNLSVYKPLVDVYEAAIHLVACTGHHLIAWRIEQQ